MAQLLREFVGRPFLEGLDLGGLERLNTKLHADTGERREADLVWRVPRRDGEEAYAILDAGRRDGALGPVVRVPEQLLEVRNMLVTRMEAWAKQSLLVAERRGEQRGELRGREQGEQHGRQEGERRGEAALLLRLLERRFGTLPGWATDRVLGAEIALLEEWSLRVLDAASLEKVFA